MRITIRSQMQAFLLLGSLFSSGALAAAPDCTPAGIDTRLKDAQWQRRLMVSEARIEKEVHRVRTSDAFFQNNIEFDRRMVSLLRCQSAMSAAQDSQFMELENWGLTTRFKWSFFGSGFTQAPLSSRDPGSYLDVVGQLARSRSAGDPRVSARAALKPDSGWIGTASSGGQDALRGSGSAR